jgi:hypothetical protein
MDPPGSRPPGDGDRTPRGADAWHATPDGRLRRELWPRIADDARLPNHYAALLALAGETPETAQQIEKDLPRTGATFAVQGLLKPGERVSPAPRRDPSARASRRARTSVGSAPRPPRFLPERASSLLRPP